MERKINRMKKKNMNINNTINNKRISVTCVRKETKLTKNCSKTATRSIIRNYKYRTKNYSLQTDIVKITYGH